MIRRTEESFHVVFIDLVLVEIQSFQPLQFRFFLPQGEKAFQREMLFLICVSIMAICAGKNMLMQHWIFSICTRKMAIYIGKIVTCQGKMPFLYYYLLLWYSKFQYQMKLIE